jgi:hypothetical protein
MADRGQISGALLDGPLAFDNAISREAAETKGIVSQVAGDPDILVVPDLESGNMLAKQLTLLTGALGPLAWCSALAIDVVVQARHGRRGCCVNGASRASGCPASVCLTSHMPPREMDGYAEGVRSGVNDRRRVQRRLPGVMSTRGRIESPHICGEALSNWSYLHEERCHEP